MHCLFSYLPLTIILAFTPAFTNATCYWPNNAEAGPDTISCGSGMSHCCQNGEACLNNGLCFSPGKGTPYRGACTVKDWVGHNSANCPTWCTDWRKSTTKPFHFRTPVRVFNRQCCMTSQWKETRRMTRLRC
jgi:hypothetical protein